MKIKRPGTTMSVSRHGMITDRTAAAARSSACAVPSGTLYRDSPTRRAALGTVFYIDKVM